MLLDRPPGVTHLSSKKILRAKTSMTETNTEKEAQT
jgi:hypothetical protein